MSKSTIITCAVTGAGDTPGKNPAVPVTPEEIATSSIDAAKAGAAILHIHVRDPETGRATGDPALFREVVERIRDSGCDAILNLTTGEGGMLEIGVRTFGGNILAEEVSTPEQRFAHVADTQPEMCTIDMGTMNVGHNIFVNTTADVTRLAELSLEAGVMPELEVFDAGQIQFSKELLAAGKVKGPAFFQLCLGVPGGSPATAETLVYMKSLLPPDSEWAAFGLGPQQFPMVAQCVISGGHARVGLEDNLYLESGKLAPSNAAMVEKAGQIITLLGNNVASPEEARAILSMTAV
ncbi:3-keto-5-aminohexanoate cleavage protein [Maritimibacter sp. DP07]|uniref:3-keto-5-aminohexanoate cleavage protein n=1 Tax=Maritimibacter harenae TaxID=2606218 RepID=A0A845M2F4_9RHOB|nr:3-keto-5-aminohexanoate cleavage protein [Maritimibacter harenae]MZR11683.1 3-keto-5-aminohexanoate cleavage protein [Maritimibacter harenae]